MESSLTAPAGGQIPRFDPRHHRSRPWVRDGLLQFHANRPTFNGLEMHLATMHKAMRGFDPRIVILDPLNSFISSGNEEEEADTQALIEREQAREDQLVQDREVMASSCQADTLTCHRDSL